MKRAPRVLGDIAIIPLTQGQEAIIDVADLPLVGDHQWFAYKSGGRFYAGRTVNHRTVPMHRVLRPVGDGCEVDHKDGDGLNNRRLNLRDATKAQNMANRRRTKSSAGFKGVQFVPKLGTYMAYLHKDKKRHRLGYYSSAEEAARAYDAGALKHHGEFAATNQALGLL